MIFDPQRAEVRARGGVRHRLRPQAASALELLVENRGSIVTHEEIRKKLWDGRYVEWEAGIHQVIRQIRRALGDDARNPRWLETVPRVGYRLRSESESCDFPDREVTPRRGARRDALMLALGTLLPPVLLAVLCVLLAGG